MSHYLDIHLRPDQELPAHQLLAALYARFHRALVRLGGNNHVAVSFPDYSERPADLGGRMRLIGPESDLVRLLALDWLRGMRDHISVGPLAAIPEGAVPRSLRRVQAKSSPDRLRRRQMRRHGLTEADAHLRIPDSAAEFLRLPFVQLASSSTGQVFRIYLRLSEPLGASLSGEFNSFGLSSAATIPWF